MLNFLLPLLKNPLSRLIISKTIDKVSHHLEREKIIPCYLGAWNEYFETSIVQKEYDLYCSFGGPAGHVDTGLRGPIYDYCKNLKDIKSIVGRRLDHKTYLETISKSFLSTKVDPATVSRGLFICDTVFFR